VYCDINQTEILPMCPSSQGSQQLLLLLLPAPSQPMQNLATSSPSTQRSCRNGMTDVATKK
jgi:hypothetical protein